MTVVLPTFPGSRVLHGWWRELEGLAVHRLWVAHLHLHGIEALVEARPASPLAGLALMLHEAMARRSTPCSTRELADELALDAFLLADLLEKLASTGRIERTPEGSWIARNTAPPAVAPNRQRRFFCFVDGEPARYVCLAPTALTPFSPADPWTFEADLLQRCCALPLEEKSRLGFPTDVDRLILPDELAEADRWRGVLLDQPLQTCLLLVEPADRPNLGLVGFQIDPETWQLGREPVLTAPPDGEALFSLVGETTPESWKQAWQAWCQQRSIPAAEADACQLVPVNACLRVQAPGRLLERLKSARSDAVRGEAWLLAGSGRVRATARLDLVGL